MLKTLSWIKHRIIASRIDMQWREKMTMKICKFLSANRVEFSMMFWTMFFMMFSKQYVIVNCCATIANFIWFEILDRNSYETNCITISIEKCKSWWLWQRFECKISSFKRLIYMHQLIIAFQYICYSNESLLHQEQNSWFTMYLTTFYRNFQRLSHIVNTWFIRDSHSSRTRICEILLITSFDAYIEVCSLKFEHQDLIIVYSFLI